MPMSGKPFILNVSNPLAARHGVLLSSFLMAALWRVRLWVSAPASQPQLKRKCLDKNQGPERLKGVLRMVHAVQEAHLIVTCLPISILVDMPYVVSPLITLAEMARPSSLSLDFSLFPLEDSGLLWQVRILPLNYPCPWTPLETHSYTSGPHPTFIDYPNAWKFLFPIICFRLQNLKAHTLFYHQIDGEGLWPGAWVIPEDRLVLCCCSFCRHFEEFGLCGFEPQRNYLEYLRVRVTR